MYDRFPCETSHFSVFNPHTSDLRGFFLSQDVILVSGGHSKSMMILWKGYGIDAILREAYEKGTILAGGSAGSVCWFDQCITDSIPGTLSVMDCLGFLPYSNCPHFGSKERQAAYSYFIRHNEIKSGYAADDDAGLHFVDGKLLRCVSSDRDDKCYNMFMNDKTYIKKRLKTFFLGEKSNQEQFIINAPCFSYMKEQAPEDHSSETEEVSTNDIQPKSDNAITVAQSE